MDNSQSYIKNIKGRLIAGFVSTLIILVTLVVLIFTTKMSESMKQQSADMLNHMNMQTNDNINNYLSRMADDLAILCTDSQVQSYNPEEQRDTIIEQKIEERIELLANAETYTTYGIVYSDGHSIGKLSNSFSKALASGNPYNGAKTHINNMSGNWTTSILPGHTELTFLRQVNESAIGIISAPTEQIRTAFEKSTVNEGMRLYLVDSALIIQCTNDTYVNAGSYLPTNIYRFVDKSVGAKIGDEYVVASAKLDNGWYVVTTSTNKGILAPLYQSVRYVLFVSAVFLLVGVIITLVIIKGITTTMSNTVTKLDVKAQTDLLTGLINKRSFEEIVQTTLDNPETGMWYALVFMDVDNFKGVNDRCGHEVGDEVLRSFAHTIGKVFRESDVKGRLGGDEFCVLMKIQQTDSEQILATVNDACRRFKDALYKRATSARQALPAVTSSMGAAIWSGAPEGFEALYRKADTAVYASKKNGKNTWSVYGQDNVDESIIDNDK